MRDLAARSDVLIENYKVDDLRRYGLDAKSLREINTELVYCSISAYGQHGSRRHKPGYDAMIQGSAGLMSITGDPDEDGGGPQKVGVAISDIMAGMYAATAILAALHERTTSGSGQHIDVPLYDSQVAWLANQNMNFLFSGETPERKGTAHPNIVPYQSFEAADGWFMLAVGSDSQFRTCAKCLGEDWLALDSRFSTNPARLENRLELIELMTKIIKQKSQAFWLDLFGSSNVPAASTRPISTPFTRKSRLSYTPPRWS